MEISTGNGSLDTALGGGLPARAATIVTGGPGTGKTTLALDFVQDGLERGEDCLYVTTDGTPTDLRAAVSSRDFDLDHPNLVVDPLYATPGYTIDCEDETLTLATDAADGTFDDVVSAPFRPRYVRNHLERYDDCDRVVLDTVTGLRPMAPDPAVFRRAVFDLVRLFSDAFGATSLLLAEKAYRDPDDGVVDDDTRGGADRGSIQACATGVIELRREQVGGDRRRLLTVRKRRGAAHDDRDLAVSIEDDGLRVHSRRAPCHPAAGSPEAMSTGIDGLDDLCGGGLCRGDVNLLRHDGSAAVAPLVAPTIDRALERDEAVLFAPGARFEWARLDDYVGDRSAAALLESDRLFVVDALERDVPDRPNAMALASTRSVADALESISRRRGGRPLYSIVDVGALQDRLEVPEMRSIRSDVRAHLTGGDDATLYVANDAVIGDSLAAQTLETASTVLRTRRRTSGLQVVTLEAGPRGRVGGTKIVEHVPEPPYVRLG